MSQTTIGDFAHVSEPDESTADADTEPAWTPTETSVNSCENCGSHVSREFVRCFGVDGSVHGCPNCTDKTKLATYAAGRDSMRDRSTPGGER